MRLFKKILGILLVVNIFPLIFIGLGFLGAMPIELNTLDYYIIGWLVQLTTLFFIIILMWIFKLIEWLLD